MGSPSFKRVNTSLEGVIILERDNYIDNRGLIGKLFNKHTFKELGISNVEYQECLYSISNKDCIRGMHYETKPYENIKLISVIQGAIEDVIVSIDKNSTNNNFGKYTSVELSSENMKSLYVPKGYAHGFKALENNTIVMYLTSQVYSSKHSFGIHYNSFGFDWNITNPIISEKDQGLPPLDSIK